MSLMRSWVPLAIGISLLSALLYIVEQHQYRSFANDPQIQMAEDAALRLQSGAKPASFTTEAPLDIAISGAPWIAIYDATGTPLVATGLLDDALPAIPRGVFEDLFTDQNAYVAPSGHEHRITWQPEMGVRQAIVIVEAGDYAVVAGRSLHETEDRVWQLGSIIGIGWIVTLVATLLAVWFGSYAQDFITISRP